MGPRTLVVALCSLLFPTISFAQNSAVLSLDTSAQNRCTKASEGALWTVRNMQTQPGNLLTVTLTKVPNFGGETQTIVLHLTAGERAELGCSAGKQGASYQIASQQ